MLATVGETIGEENPDIRGDMQDACRESRSVSSALEKLCESMSHTVIGNQGSSPGSPLQLRTTKNSLVGLGMITQADLEALVRTLRRLLAAVTRILLLADNVVVKQLLVASSTTNSVIIDKMGSVKKKKNGSSPGQNHVVGVSAGMVSGGSPSGRDRGTVLQPVNTATSLKASISTMHHFNEFVKAFCDFGSDMVHLIRITAGMLKFISTFFDQKFAVAILEKLTFVGVICVNLWHFYHLAFEICLDMIK